ncbi:Amino acid permease [Fragilaria crotonensis]|nr:Amino acid permease [Fragilaria crotonensis]
MATGYIAIFSLAWGIRVRLLLQCLLHPYYYSLVVHQTKAATNWLTVVKIGLVVYMILVGFSLVHPSNWTPFIPPQFGVANVIRGSTATFFGYLGYDEVCQLAGEARDPKRNLPIAIMITLGGVTLLYITAALALTGMQPFEDISSISGFPVAFRANGNLVAARIAALGEIFTLPVVVILTMIGQPRLQYALAKDGLLPSWFGIVDANGNFFNGTLFCGIVCIVLSTFIPFSHLNDMISAAVLTALNITDTSLVTLWYDSPPESPYLAEKFLGVFHVACFSACLLLTRYLNTAWGSLWFVVAALVAFICMIGVFRFCPKNTVFGGNRRRKDSPTADHGFFRTPFLPFWPCAGVFINWYLIAQLELIGTMGMLGFLVVVTVVYLLFRKNGRVGNRGYWNGTPVFPTEQTVLVRSVSSSPQTQA